MPPGRGLTFGGTYGPIRVLVRIVCSRISGSSAACLTDTCSFFLARTIRMVMPGL